jgi:hypothetical protein
VGPDAAGPAGGELAGPAAAQAGLSELAILEPAAFPLAAAALTAATVGAVHYGVMVRPGALPAASYLTGFYNSGTIVMKACIGFVLLLTPTGSLPSPRWRGLPGWWWPPRSCWWCRRR